MPFIDTSYFDGLLGLDNITLPAIGAAVDDAISHYEDEYLRLILGPSLYDAFMAGIDAGNRSYFSDQFSDQFVKSGLDGRWAWIRDGHTFMGSDGRSYKWLGLINATKQSPISCYVYWNYRADNLTRPTATGEKLLKSENADNASPCPRLVRVWNRMVDMNAALDALVRLTETYPEFDTCASDAARRDLFCRQNIFNI